MATEAEIESLRLAYVNTLGAVDRADAALLQAQTQYGVGSPQTAEYERVARAARADSEAALARYDAVRPRETSPTSWVPWALGAALIGGAYLLATAPSQPVRELKYAYRRR